MSNKDKTALRNVACAKNNSAIINDTDKNMVVEDAGKKTYHFMIH